MDQLETLAAQIQAVSDRAAAVAARVGTDQIATRPRPESWSVAECLIHLAVTTDAYLPLWAEASRTARAQGLVVSRASSAPFRLDLPSKLLSWFLEPPPKLRFSTPARFHPIDPGPPANVLHRFLASQALLLDAMADARGLAIDQIKITSPFSSRLRYSVWSSFCVNSAHQRRHAWQAERVADQLARG